MSTPNVSDSLFIANFLLLKELENIREPQEYTGNEPTLDISIEDSMQDKKKKGKRKENDKYMPLVINIMMMKTCLSTKYRNGG